MRPRRSSRSAFSWTMRSRFPPTSNASTSAPGRWSLSSRPPSTASDYLATPLQFLKGVGPRRASDLRRAGLVTVEDLLYRFPFRYEDRTKMQPIASLRPGARAAVTGEIKSTQLAVTRRRGFKIFHAVVGDSSGAIRCSWMNQAYLADVIAARARSEER